MLLLREFGRYIVLALCVALPLAYLAALRWLQEFAYRTNIGFEILLTATAVVCIVAFATVIYQCLRAAATNPVETLRYE